MQTRLSDSYLSTPQGREADAILRSCVHCGFCTATCPTYQLLGDEDDGPRGRIYLIKSVLEGNRASDKTLRHLDRCLTCRACETTCPSGVNYHRLLNIGRAEVERQVTRPPARRLLRFLVLLVLPRRVLFTPLYRLAQLVRPLLPTALREKILSSRRARGDPPTARHRRRVVLLQGCVQPAMAPAINTAAARVLDALGISLEAAPGQGCCGAMHFHMNEQEAAAAAMRRNVDAWRPALARGAGAVVTTASGCATQLKSYGELLRADPVFAGDAGIVAEKTRDIAELLLAEEPALLARLGERGGAGGRRVAFHSPCSLQHGQRITDTVERLLQAAGYRLLPLADSHLCCGSAGTYSIFEPELSGQLRDNKVRALLSGDPECIATANIGCLAHMQPRSPVPVVHWIELIEQVLYP
jgi:glycolate oxidase iron-sulfur subunit